MALSMLVLMAWSAILPKPQSVVNEQVTPSDQQLSPSRPVSPIINEIESRVLGESVYYAHHNALVDFSESGASIKSVTFENHQDYVFNLQSALLVNDASLIFQLSRKDPNLISFGHSDENKKIVKEISFLSDYNFNLRINVQNTSKEKIHYKMSIMLGVLDYSSINSRYQDVYISTPDKTFHAKGNKEKEFVNLNFLGIREKYFCLILEPNRKGSSGFIKRIGKSEFEVGLESPEFELAPGESYEEQYNVYLGPQDVRIINQINQNWASVVYYGMFDFIAQLLLQALHFFHNILKNWGLSIIFLSVCIYFLLFPLSLKQMRSMKQMQILQPKIEELRKAYKDNPQKLNKEIMELYREHKVNPMSGCLPLILQMPFFISLWEVFQRSVVLMGASFLWIKDLASPDRLIVFSGDAFVKEINILPLVTAVLMFLQSKATAGSATGEQAQQQKMMTVIFPVIFGFAFYNMPSGWMLYFTVNSFLMFVNQSLIGKRK